MATTSTTGVIDSTNWQTATRTVSSTTDSGSYLDMQDFYELMAAQLKYQDMDNPLDTSEMMAQMVQMQMISTISEMNQLSYISYASSLVGKEVTVAEVDSNGNYTGDYTVGTVTGANVTSDPPTLVIDGYRYDISQLVLVGSNPSLVTTTTEEEEDEEEESVTEVAESTETEDTGDTTAAEETAAASGAAATEEETGTETETETEDGTDSTDAVVA